MKTGMLTIMAVLAMQAATAQSTGDAALLRMQDAYRKNQSTVLSQTLPQVRGHVLQPMAAYWEMRARLDGAPVNQIQDRLAALQGSYWEDRLRADWLALLARREQWDLFDAQWPLYRMRDERSLLCSGTLRDWQRGLTAPERAAADIGTTVYAGTPDYLKVILDKADVPMSDRSLILNPDVFDKIAGDTTITTGTLALSGSGSINNSAIIDVQSAGTLSIAGVTTSTTIGGTSAQTLKGLGTVNLGTKTLTIGSFEDSPAVLNLPNVGTDVVVSLVIDGVEMPAGIYDASNSGGAITGSGKIEVPAVGGFATWVASPAFGLALADQGPTDDPDLDGIENLLEYVLNGNPAASDLSILPVLDASGANCIFSFERRSESADDTVQVFEYNSDLGAVWTEIAIPATSSGSVTITPNSPVEGVDQVQVSVPKGENIRLFGRLKVTQ
jgi:hypothetical protein